MRRQINLYLVFVTLILLVCACSPQPSAAPTGEVQPEFSQAPPTTAALPPPTQVSPEIIGSTPEDTPIPATPVPTESQPTTCSPTEPDMLGPFYTPGAPERNKVGEGYLISGLVLSADGCTPIPGAQIEVWMAGPDGEYRDDYRATFFSDDNGSYTFESHFPPSYSNRPPHHHFLVSATGFEDLVTQHYPQPGESQATLDLVLIPIP